MVQASGVQKMKFYLIIFALLLAFIYAWWLSDTYSLELPVPDEAALAQNRMVYARIQAAQRWMGPRHQYRVVSGMLQVSKNHGSTWERLRY